MKHVLIHPPWKPWLGNRMFTGAEGCVYVHAFALWRELAAQRGIQLDTIDVYPLSHADCVWMMDLPMSRRTLKSIRREVRKDTPLVLQTLESPLLTPCGFVESNRRHFDVVVTFECGVGESNNRFTYHLPNRRQFPSQDLPFQRRRCAVMVNSNRVEGLFAMRQPSLVGLPGVGKLLGGWRPPIVNVIFPAAGELYSWRRALARAADSMDGQVLDVFGRGWQGEQISWFPGYGNRPYRCALGRDQTCVPGSENRRSKGELLSHYRFAIAVENYRGSRGYISEKLFDAVMAGCVPVYLGEERITDKIPASCFVDVRHFSTPRELLSYLYECSEQEWLMMRKSGQQFLESRQFLAFTDEAFADQMTRLLVRILNLQDAGSD